MLRINGADVAILTDSMQKSFGSVKALSGVDLVLVKGTILALLGPNGAGKTTLVRILTTLLKPDSGEGYVAGFEISRDPGRIREVIGLSGQYASIDENLTGRENLEMVGRLYHMSKMQAKNRAAELLDMLELSEFADRYAKTYSGGQRRRLDLAASLVAKPKILFLDEPTTGLDPRSRVGLWKVIKDLVRDGTSLLLTTQYLEEADRLADWIAVIDHGRIIEQGSARDLKSKIGGDVLELHITDPSRTYEAAKSIIHLGTDRPQLEHDSGKISLPVEGASVIAEVIRTLDRMNIGIEDIAMHRPTLDDVFLALTGHASEEEKP